MTFPNLDDTNLNPYGSPIAILDSNIPLAAYCKINLSIANPDLDRVVISDPKECQLYIDQVLESQQAMVAYGGYLEKRNLYATANRFSKGEARNIHLGMDFWCKAGTKVVVPMDAKVHSFANNSDLGNYGPTIILSHTCSKKRFYTLYGHLAVASLTDLYIGKEFKRGEILGSLGTTDINVNYAPHLHFQMIKNLGDYMGDYPGVCNTKNLDFYKNNCPDPNRLLQL